MCQGSDLGTVMNLSLFQIMCCINAGCNQSLPPPPTASTFFFFLLSLQLSFQGIFWLGAMSSLNVCAP